MLKKKNAAFCCNQQEIQYLLRKQHFSHETFVRNKKKLKKKKFHALDLHLQNVNRQEHSIYQFYGNIYGNIWNLKIYGNIGSTKKTSKNISSFLNTLTKLTHKKMQKNRNTNISVMRPLSGIKKKKSCTCFAFTKC